MIGKFIIDFIQDMRDDYKIHWICPTCLSRNIIHWIEEMRGYDKAGNYVDVKRISNNEGYQCYDCNWNSF